MALRVLFVPFDVFHEPSNRRSTAGRDQIEKNEVWINSYKAWVAVREGDTAHDVYQAFQSATATRSILQSLGAGDQACVRGHALAGFHGIFDHANIDEARRDAIPEARSAAIKACPRDRLVERVDGGQYGGEPPEGNGAAPRLLRHRQCYNCFGAEGDPSFATALTQASRGLVTRSAA